MEMAWLAWTSDEVTEITLLSSLHKGSIGNSFFIAS
jgi:hypothetical protein